MSTSLATLRQLLSAEVGDLIFGSCASTTTSAGAAGGTTLIDSSLMSKPADFIRTGEGGEPQTAILLTSGTYSGQVRYASGFAIATGTITVSNAFGGQVASGVTYEIHRLADPALKEDCIAKATKDAYPSLYILSDTEIHTFGDWLLDGHFEEWASSSSATYWTASGTTLERTSNTLYGGTYAMGLKTDTGYVGQSSANNKDLLQLGGTTPHFYARVTASTASQVRLAIYDGTTTTYSSYHTGGGAAEWLDVSATIADNPTDVAFRVYYASTVTTAYVHEVRVLGAAPKYSYDLSGLSLVNGVPNLVYTVEGQNAATEYPRPLGDSVLCSYWKPLGSNRILFTHRLTDGTRLRIVGRKYLTEPTSSVSTEADAPQTYIISALAAKRLYGILAGTGPSHSVEAYREREAYWEQEAESRKRKFGMVTLPITRTLY